MSRQADLDDMTDKAQALTRTSHDSRMASQASQLITKYQTLNMKELLRRWEQIVCDHQAYDDAYHNCAEWQKDVAERLKSCSSTDGDKYVLQKRLSKLRELLSLRDEGYHKLQQATDAANLTLPNTSPVGKDAISEELQTLKQDWENLLGQLNDSKAQLEAALSQWDLYDDTIASLLKWLTDMEGSLKAELGLQATLLEKRSQQERVKVC